MPTGFGLFMSVSIILVFNCLSSHVVLVHDLFWLLLCYQPKYLLASIAVFYVLLDKAGVYIYIYIQSLVITHQLGKYGVKMDINHKSP